MAEATVSESADGLLVELDESLYPKDAIYGAAYVFIDRCYVRLDRPAPGRISLRLKPKAHVEIPLATLAGELENELLGQAWRRLLIDENRRIVETVTTQALAGAAGPPGLDELLEMDLEALLQDEAKLKEVQKVLGPGASVSELKPYLKDVKGLKINDPVVTIAFR